VQCVGCGSLERGRYQWLVLQKRVVLPAGAVIGHFAPERFFMDHFAGRRDVTYLAFDKHPRHYRHAEIEVRELDLCTDMETLPSASFDLLLHSHVLEHLPCEVAPVLRHMKRLLKTGGVMLFSVPIDGEFSSEGVDPPKSAEELSMRQRQGDHLRIFGRRDFPEKLAGILESDCLVRQKDVFTEDELMAAHVPIARKGEPTGKSVFLYRKE
jgi:SAM-dependent methyltransferase